MLLLTLVRICSNYLYILLYVRRFIELLPELVLSQPGSCCSLVLRRGVKRKHKRAKLRHLKAAHSQIHNYIAIKLHIELIILKYIPHRNIIHFVLIHNTWLFKTFVQFFGFLYKSLVFDETTLSP